MLLVVLPYSLGIVVASVLGVLAGLCVDGGRAQADGKNRIRYAVSGGDGK
ncbi:hypothetical protein J4734_03940 [Klebsiella pneumoniae]|uniref:Uncharacterized protein n=1 Tax=Klebsiella pneumoniae TaxID=573 RepID=A0A939SUE1_KLEPN|nr:hypothetical protein [Klebsiella pneumoniae]